MTTKTMTASNKTTGPMTTKITTPKTIRARPMTARAMSASIMTTGASIMTTGATTMSTIQWKQRQREQ